MIRILFVCTGNTCRSPMAEALAKSALSGNLAGEIEISSAGTAATEGRPAADNAVDVLSDLGVDLSGHRARQLTTALAGEADLVVAMTRAHRDSVIEMDPSVGSRVILLGELDHGRNSVDIDDPIGGDRRIYERSRNEIKGLIDLLVVYVIEKYELNDE